LKIHAAKFSLAAAVLLTFAVCGGKPVKACACCSNDGQRNVRTQKIDAYASGILSDIRFDEAAKLYTGEGESDGGWKLAGSADFRLVVSKHDADWSFEFTQPETSGTLTFALPTTVTKFEIDPREAPAAPNGPTLYKEWRLTAPGRGNGMFKDVTGGDQQATLILHGRGNSCTDATQFTAWTIVLHGAKLTTSFFGTLSAQ
jgi:hypothetical protein